MTADEVTAFLRDPCTGVLTTLDRDGWPHSTGMWFLPYDPILMWTYAKSQKARNVARDPRCSFLVERGTTYNELRGVMVRAEARLIGDPQEVTAIGMALFERYHDAEEGSLPEAVAREVARQARKRVGLALSMDKVTSWDHRKL